MVRPARREHHDRYLPFYGCPFPSGRADGFSLTEVLVAMVLLTLGVLGTLWGFQWAQQGLESGDKATRALALAESKLDAKRAARWRTLLHEDTDGDGRPDTAMRDDGLQGEGARGGDGIFSASWEEEGIHLSVSVQPDRPGPLWQVGSAIIQVHARYHTTGGWRGFEIGTLRANPNYIGPR